MLSFVVGLDAPGVLHDIMIRGIEHQKIFRNSKYILLMADRPFGRELRAERLMTDLAHLKTWVYG